MPCIRPCFIYDYNGIWGPLIQGPSVIPFLLRRIHFAHLFTNVFFLNVPFLVIRVIVKTGTEHGESSPVSFMIVKNVLLIMQGIREIYAILLTARKERVEEDKTAAVQAVRF